MSDEPYWAADAGEAVANTSDTDIDSLGFNYNHKQSCSRTQRTENPWWVVDLGSEYWVHEIHIEAPKISTGK